MSVIRVCAIREGWGEVRESGGANACGGLVVVRGDWYCRERERIFFDKPNCIEKEVQRVLQENENDFMDVGKWGRGEGKWLG